MSQEQLFSLVSFAVVPAWLLLLLAPRWRWTPRLAGLLLPAALGVVYLGLVAANWGGDPEAGYGSLAAVAALFADRWLLLAGWVHYLAFDLFIGAWELRDARRLRIHHLLLAPCLVLTFLFGPVGLLAYLGLRATRARGSELGVA